MTEQPRGAPNELGPRRSAQHPSRFDLDLGRRLLNGSDYRGERRRIAELAPYDSLSPHVRRCAIAHAADRRGDLGASAHSARSSRAGRDRAATSAGTQASTMAATTTRAATTASETKRATDTATTHSADANRCHSYRP